MKSNDLNDLFDYDYKIFQNDDYFKFSIDSVLLAEFVDLKKNQKELLDLCSGNAPIPMILNKKYGNRLNITAIELQKEIYDLGIKSLNYNKITNVDYCNCNVLDVPKNFCNKKFDIITCNPPYFKTYSEENINNNQIKAIARHEIEITLEQIIQISAKVINNQGYLYIVHRPERVADIIQYLKKYNFGLKKVQPIYNDHFSNSCFILIEAIYNGKDYVIINQPIFLKDYTTYKNIFRK